MGIWIWSTLTVENSHRVGSRTGLSQRMVCFMDLAKIIIEVCVCVRCGCWLAASHTVFTLQTRGGALVAHHTHTDSGGQTQKLSHECLFHIKREMFYSASSFAPSRCPPFFLLFLSLSADLQINRTRCPDTVSRLPNEVSNYEPCCFLCGTGCDWAKEGTETQIERGRRGVERENSTEECKET